MIPDKMSIWNEISTNALKSAIEKMNRVSAGKWAINDNSIFDNYRQNNYDSVCAYFDVNMKYENLNFALFFNRKDIDIISRCFLGYSFFVSEKMTKKEELLIGEIGNILLNSLISALCNKLNIKLIPSIPKVIQAEKEFALDVIMGELPSTRQKSVYGNIININCEGKNIFCEIFSFLPESIIKLIG